MEPIGLTAGDDRTVTVLLSTFAGLGLPRTLSLPTHASTSVQDVLQTIHNRLPPVDRSLIITTTDNKQLLSSNTKPVASLLSDLSDTFLPLRLSARLCGGKGGFGSQLRAAGGRMSSRKKRDQNGNVNGSSRNLQGHRLRVVAEAKRVTEALAKHEKEAKKEEEEKRKRRQDQMDSLENTIEQMRAGKLGGDRGRLKAEYVESKELAEQQTRAAVLANYSINPSSTADEVLADAPPMHKTGSESSLDAIEDGSDEEVEEGTSSTSSEEVAPGLSEVSTKADASSAAKKDIPHAGPAFFGWDDDDDEDEDEEGD